MTKVTEPAARATLDAAARQLGDPAALAKSLVGDSAGEYQSLVEEGWQEQVLTK